MLVLFVILVLIVLVVAAVPVAAVLGLLGFALDEIAMRGRLTTAIGDIVWEKSTDFLLLSVPLFILLGQIMLRSGIARDMYQSVAMWISWVPGGLMHANIGACTLFAATSGSSVATTATIGAVAYPEIEMRGYNERLFMGSLAAGGTLGILIPPSLSLILFGVMTNTSIPELYMAGLVPGLILAFLFMAVIVLACIIRRDWGGTVIKASWTDRIRGLPALLGPILIFGAVVGSIYAGIATPTEAASVGVVVALILTAYRGRLTVRMLLSAFEATMSTTAMVLIIVYAALFLNFVLSFMGITKAMLGFIEALSLSPVETMLVIVLFYLILGMFMETLSMMLTTLPIVFPIVMALDVPEYSGVWFGIMLTLLMEAALITPPVGLNLYVAQGIRTRGGKFSDVAIGSLPFLIAMIMLTIFLIFFPEVATWLPDQFYR